MADKTHVFLLTTVDNPYSPFDSFTQWYMEDLRLGHDTCGLLARIAQGNDVLPDDAELYAMRSIVELNASGKHVIVVPTDYNPFLSPDVKALGVESN